MKHPLINVIHKYWTPHAQGRLLNREAMEEGSPGRDRRALVDPALSPPSTSQ